MRKILHFILTTLIIIPLFLKPILSANASWVKHSKQPVLPYGPNAWENWSVGSPTVIHDGSSYTMWYEGNDSFTWKIGRATSIDGITWNKYSTYVLDINYDNINKNAHNPSVIYSKDKYLMWYAASDPSINNIHINYTNSTNGIDWGKSTIGVLTPFYPWENKGISFPRAISLNNNEFAMWYGATGNKTNWRIGYATSTDGVTWTKDPEPVLTADSPWENVRGRAGVGNPAVLLENGIYHMWYHADRDIGHATSLDGIKWDKDPNNPVLGPESDITAFDNWRVMDPFVLKSGDTYYMWYTGVDRDDRWQIGLATTKDISSTTVSPTPTTAPTVTPSPTLLPSPTLTPTPTPTPIISPSFSPIIIVPGMGASWNPNSMFSCNLISSGSWKIAPYVSIYKRLIKTLTNNARLKLGSEVFLYAYDWRQPLDRQGEALKNYIDQVLAGRGAGTKVRLIGHSLGGLVIRSYLANNPNSHKAKSVLTVGSPHQGTVLAYPIWEKGEIWTADNIMKIAISQLVTHCRLVQPFVPQFTQLPKFHIKTIKEVVQILVPSVQQLLPTFDYLKYDGEIKKTEKLIYQNGWLNSHLIPANILGSNFFTLSGNNNPTLRFLDVVDPTKIELGKGDWLDGKPVEREEVNSGDGTVLNLSSQIEGATNITIAGNHGEIISATAGIQKILDFLGLEKVKPADMMVIPEEVSEKILTISIDKEAKLQLMHRETPILESEENIIVYYNPAKGNYRLIITPYVSGRANLHVTFFKNDRQQESKTYALILSKNIPFTLLIPVNE